MRKSKIICELVRYLLSEKIEYENIDTSISDSEMRILLKHLINVREPKELPPEILELEDELLQIELKEKTSIDINTLIHEENNIYLWKGDIATINASVIVNAGNSRGLGCFAADHYCIDNVIHSNAGMRLRYECNSILKGKHIENGGIIICSAYNLPCEKVITTVGPQINKTVTKQDINELANCYKNSLQYAIDNKFTSIVFPCISTGLFSFPMSIAKETAYNAVKEVLKDNDIKVVFNVFSEEDYNEYKSMFENKRNA